MESRRILEDLAENLECPICLELPTGEPIFSCVVGHLICYRCHRQITSCPLCRGKLHGTRSFIAEKSAAVVGHFMCASLPAQPEIGASNVRSSCSEDAPGRLVRCSLAVHGCRNMLLSSASYIDHLKTKHGALVVHSATGTCTHKISIAHTPWTFVKRGVERLFIIEIAGKSYIINMCQEGKEIRIWAETEMRSNEAMNQSKVRISIHDADNLKTFSWSGPINGFHVTDKSVSMSGNCLKTTTEQMKTCLQEDLNSNRFWKIHVEISSPSVFALGMRRYFGGRKFLGNSSLVWRCIALFTFLLALVAGFFTYW